METPFWLAIHCIQVDNPLVISRKMNFCIEENNQIKRSDTIGCLLGTCHEMALNRL